MTVSSQSSEQVIVTADGHRVVGRLFAPPAAAMGAVLIVSAMGTAQTFYAPFAAWLASEGYLVATFDYRGTGESRVGGLRGFKANLFDWARLDCGAALDALAARAPGAPLYWIGHSLGGQLLPFVPNHARLTRAITIAAGSGYWRENAPALRRRVWWLWYVAVPLAIRLTGYFPGRRLRKVGDLPRGVMEQWRRWCLHPEYAVGAEPPSVGAQFSAVTTPIVSLSFTDDELMSGRNIDALHACYVNAPRTMRRLSPEEAALPAIGHFGFFKARNERALWRRYLLPELAAAAR